jgi:hypothetical protein
LGFKICNLRSLNVRFVVTPPLDLPPFEYRLREAEGRRWIFDTIRKKFVVLTPEEWVRQHVVNYITAHLNYPRALVRIEGGLSYNQLAKRSDIVIYDRAGGPWMVVECKAPTLRVSAQVIHQAAAYNHTLRARYVVVSNGVAHVVCAVENGEVSFLQRWPEFPQVTDDGSR